MKSKWKMENGKWKTRNEGDKEKGYHVNTKRPANVGM